MDKISSYGIYQNNYYDRTKNSKTGKATETKDTKETSQKQNVELSSSAKKLLKELQKKYGNTDFIVANYDSDEEAASYLSRGTSQYSVLLTPDELEKMASDEDVKEKNLKTLDDAFAKLDEMKDQLGENGQQVSRLGVSIGNDGEISFFAELEEVSEKQRERIEEQRENKREEARKAENDQAAWNKRPPEPVKRTTVYASSVDELAEKIGKVDWSKISEEYTSSGQRFNFTV